MDVRNLMKSLGWICLGLFLLAVTVLSANAFEAIPGAGDDFIPMIIFEASCTESWSCTDWSSCSDSTQTRTCTEYNNCGTNSTKPSESQACASGSGSDPGLDEDTMEEITGKAIDFGVDELKTSLLVLFLAIVVIVLFANWSNISVMFGKKKKKKKIIK